MNDYLDVVIVINGVVADIGTRPGAPDIMKTSRTTAVKWITYACYGKC